METAEHTTQDAGKQEWQDRVRATIMDSMEDAPETLDGEDAPSDEPEVEETPETPDVEAKEEAPATSKWSLEDPDDYSSYQALRKAQWPHNMLEQLGRDELRMRGEKAAKMFAEVDRRLSTKGVANETDEPKSAEPDKGPTHSGSSAIAQSVRTIVDALGLEESEATGLTTGLQAVVEHAVKPYADQMAKLAGQLETILVGSAVRSLEEEIPSLKNADYRQKVAARAIRLGNAGEAEGLTGEDRIRELFRIADRLESPDAPSKSEKQRQQKRDHWRKNGVPSGTTAKTKPAAPKNNTDRIIGIMDAVEQGVPEDEIMARYSVQR